MKKIIFVAALILISIQAFSQDYILKGKITANNKAIEGASVMALGENVGTQTDAQGNYSISLKEGSYTFLFTYGNSRTVEVLLDKNTTIDVDLSKAAEVLDEVFLSALRVNAQSPITYSNLSNEEIEDRNLGQDIPVLMSYMPNVVTTSDAGAGVGYTGIRVRGSDATRVNVTINGVPYNDSESQGTFWVNLPDFASSVENIQLQRGVGTSTNGAGAFGASLNILTDGYSTAANAETSHSFGSYNTRKHTVKFSTGLMNDHWEIAGRASQIKSDGYIDRASSDLKSYFLQAAYVNDNTLIKALMFGGTEKTYQAWYGIDGETLSSNRTFNPAGAYTSNGEDMFYDNQTDNYQQDHYQLLWNQKFDPNWSSNFALHYTRGKGYYEEFNEDASLNEFGLQNFMADGMEITTSDLVGRKWLDNDFYGATFNLNYQNSKLDLDLGGGLNRYEGDHFGDVIYTRFAKNGEPSEHYYFNDAVKTDFNIYSKANFAITEKLAAYVDLQIRTIDYVTDGLLDDQTSFNVDDNFSFFNPKAGLTYQLNDINQFYFSYARANREPSRADYENGNPESEGLNDFELGWRYKAPKVQINTNVYLMDYQNQLVLTGGIDDEGAFVRENSGNSYRLGLEIDASIQISDKFKIRPNFSVSRNKNVDFVSNFNGELNNFGDTDISYSPEIVAGNILSYTPINNLQFSLLSKYVGDQYMSNIEAKNSKLDSYFVNDLNVQYTIRQLSVFKEVTFTALVNNILNEKYVSNGYYYTYDVENPDLPSGVQTFDGAGYYPQATTNFLAGITLKF
ncbi:TonB-dependent receptor [Gillisia sp. Hel_I_29]|uniref:TonB-dependent receptor n=1 Tax=Gillisia sp. Hel_I_29 TaxID=1249975 RepID=UPI000555325A|nr:TonB-dependent receptor [Gillisia sp. Hel_I_29]